MFLKVVIFIVALCLTIFESSSSVWGAVSEGICPSILGEYKVQNLFSKQSYLRDAVKAVFKDYEQRGMAKPKYLADPAIKNEDLIARDSNFNNFMDILPIENVKLISREPTETGYGVERVVVGSKTYYLRTIQRDMLDSYTRKVRLELSASTLNQTMGLQVVPKTKLVKVDNVVGSLSESVVGHVIEHSRSTDPSRRMEAHGFEFLVGNVDSLSRNMLVDREGVVKVFDHDFAFVLGIVKTLHHDENAKLRLYANSESLFGPTLPETYTEEFKAGLRKLTDKQIEKKFEYLLNEDERQALRFRRDILLKDIELRGL